MLPWVYSCSYDDWSDAKNAKFVCPGVNTITRVKFRSNGSKVRAEKVVFSKGSIYCGMSQ